MRKIILISTFTSILFLSGCQTFGTNPDFAQESQSTTTNLTLDVTKNNSPYMGDTIAGTTSPLLEFTQEDYNQAISENKLAVLYFYNDHEIICIEELEYIKAAFDNLNIPNVIGFKIDYNTDESSFDEQNIANVFDVTNQNTKILIRNTDILVKNSDSWNQEKYIEKINNYI